VINPLLVAGQIQGGVAQAIGQALYEEIRYDGGQPFPTLLADYAVPRAAAIPPVTVLRTETPSPRNPLGVPPPGSGRRSAPAQEAERGQPPSSAAW